MSLLIDLFILAGFAVSYLTGRNNKDLKHRLAQEKEINAIQAETIKLQVRTIHTQSDMIADLQTWLDLEQEA